VTTKHLLINQTAKGKPLNLKARKALLQSYPQEEELNEPIYIQLLLPELRKNNYIKVHPDEDVLIIQIGKVYFNERGQKKIRLVDGADRVSKSGEGHDGSLVGAQLQGIKTFDEVSIGNDVFIFGYPSSIGIEDYPQIDATRPLLRKGIVAGKNPKKKTIIIDAPVQQGNSGGPVIEVEADGLTKSQYRIIGMISEYIPAKGKRLPFLGRQVENSGYSVVIPMDTVLDLMSEVDSSSAKVEA